VFLWLLVLVLAFSQDASPPGVALRLIVVNSAAEAAAIHQQLEKGADFAVLAREKSIDATSVDGGLMGAVDPSILREELRAAIRGLAPGKISVVFQLPSGFAIAKVLAESELVNLATVERARRFAVSVEGNIRFVFDISGLNEAESALASYPKPPGWNLDLAQACAMRQQSFAAVADRAEKLLAAADPRRSHADTMSLRVARGQLYAYRGEMEKAIPYWEAAYRTASNELPRALPYLDELLGIGYLHKSQIANDVYRSPGERCLFPIRPAFKFAKTGDSEAAIAHFLAFLRQKPDDIEVKWLLNVAYMTLGRYPAGVPKEHLLAPSLFASAEDIGRFPDVAKKAGLDLFSMAAGIIVDDFDNDGLLDVVTSSFDMCAPMHFFHNKGDGTFEDRSAAPGLADQLGGLNIIQADYNNDGCLDILVLRGGWEIPQRKSLLRNNCNGTFTDVTKEAGLAEPTSTQTAVWADIDNDGLLDLYVGNENGPNQLFRNKGDGTFEDISHRSGTDIVGFTKAVVAADYDNDGYVDFYVSNYRGDNALFHNRHDGTFVDVARQAGVLGPGHGFPAWFFDYDNDGWPDILVSSYYMSVEETVRTYLGLPHNANTMKLYRNLGNGAFKDVTGEAGLDKVFMPMGANFGDVDNDGYLDIYFGTGDPSYSSLLPNVLLHNKEGKRFVDITASSGTGELHKGHGVAFADIDNDGDEDILTVIGGATPGDSHAFRLFENPGHGNDWISVKLVGTKANRSAIGAKIKVALKSGRAIYRTVGSGGSFGASPLEQHIGLGKSAAITSLEVTWPGGARQRFTDVAANQAIEIKQDASEYRKLERHPVKLGGARQYKVTGIVLKVDPARRTFEASCAAIPGYMEAMAMPYPVRDAKELANLKPGASIEFTLVVEKDDSWAEGIRPHRFESMEREPLTARRLQLLEPPAASLAPGQAVPDFALIDQTGRRVALSQFAGKVVGMTFIYTSCPLPNYCFRLSNNFGQLSKRFAGRLDRDLILLTLTIDPVNDTPEVLAKYASTWKADPKSWHFLTGPPDEVKATARRLGLNFWQDEGLFTHSLHTLVIGRDGKLAADFEGNEFTALQLGDFLQALMDAR
jgi:cytochrome oxidase Cu insertion factor (SCO1/SenC/PrrC family)/tetratricopeptide (TPR) repeat protein